MVFIRLEDGRGLAGTTVSMCALLILISEQIPNDFSELKIWLADKAKRPSPFIDLDLGGLDARLRDEFYLAAQRAREQVLQKDPSLLERSDAVGYLTRLLDMRACILRGEPPLANSDFDYLLRERGTEDLSEIWDC